MQCLVVATIFLVHNSQQLLADATVSYEIMQVHVRVRSSKRPESEEAGAFIRGGRIIEQVRYMQLKVLHVKSYPTATDTCAHMLGS